ncbi:hypothetical protein [Methanobrevibacter filiformis]|uniref:Uncharacterized protein n=1 Tax=Methanobrevibacter filiformis TaxID=55758 RepID=A0A162FID5_9EURY|nr:hypothetical protein [Methanobrevibacter filiformis]KZX10440.1 hypothetical protein MBFIL_17390 [Methanobrevibacter filiformis]
MNLMWFYIAIALAISDELHSKIMWNVFQDFYIIFGGMLNEILSSNMQVWLTHELIEAVFHFVFMSIVCFSFQIGFLAAVLHLVIDITHTLTIHDESHLEHRAIHFVIESLFFIAICGF